MARGWGFSPVSSTEPLTTSIYLFLGEGWIQKKKVVVVHVYTFNNVYTIVGHSS